MISFGSVVGVPRAWWVFKSAELRSGAWMLRLRVSAVVVSTSGARKREKLMVGGWGQGFRLGLERCCFRRVW